ncbi:hypothetical protein GCM10009574_095910 [Streptomyces asiaticus]|uniref:Uncharacterized protein n=1 Tax=Streptomyces rhizosphaericus TaxID=114699 RepID=A0ABP4BWD5_9ACTN
MPIAEVTLHGRPPSWTLDILPGLGDVGVGDHTLNLSAADRANIDQVCSAIKTCVVLDVAGRPQIVTAQLPNCPTWTPS